MKRSAPLLLLGLCLATPASAQLRDKIGELFIFGSGTDPLFLAGTADPSNPASIQAHGSHFIPASVEGNATLIAFLTSAIGTNVANLPIGATSSGRTFSFVDGVPVATSTSHGPVFAERAQTLGAGRVLVGASINQFNFKAVRGADLHDLQLNFTHANADFAGCDSIYGADCSKMGAPTLENDFIQLRLALDLNVRSTVFVLTYGLMDWLDVGVAVPLVSTSLRGTSEAQVFPFGGTSAAHFFAGTSTNPELSASRFVEGSATGVGDISARAKIRLAQSERSAFAVLADARFATGAERDLLGSGHTSVRGLGVVSARFGPFSPHANVGYLYRSGGDLTDAVLATGGFDHALSDWATLAVDVLAELQAQDTRLTLPDPVQIEIPFRRTIIPSNIPNMRDDIVNGSLGLKLQAAPGLLIVGNALWPLNRGGLRPSTAWTAGVEYNF
jgi:hypothetical protein